jgi:Secretion system C-terminal sorting domain
MNKLLLFIGIFLLSYFCPIAQTGTAPGARPLAVCPNVNIAVARAGLNKDTLNPYYIYSVNSTTGAISLYPGGPLLDPANPAKNLQVNAIGVNPNDCFVYGLVYQGNLATAAFAKFNYNYDVTLFGNVPSPTSTTGSLAFVNSGAGDVDKSNNYYFSALTANAANTTSGLIIDKLFLGKISNISNVTGTPAVTYSEIDYSSLAASPFISGIAADPNNSGIKDFSYNPLTKSFLVYATYIIPGATNFSGQLFELKPVAGSSPLKYKAFAYTIVNSNSGETSGSYIDKAGDMVILLTDGTIGKMRISDSAFHYSGKFDTLNVATGFPNPIRADMGSYGGTSSDLPVVLSSFKVFGKDCKTTFLWTTQSEINFDHYELQQSFEGNNFVTIGSVKAKNAASGSNYSYTIPAAGKLALYRLMMVDIDGKITYSSILPINNTCSKNKPGFLINPNPAGSFININWYGFASSASVKLNIYNAIGELMSNTIKSVPAGNSAATINVSSYSSGVYIIKAIDTKTNESFEQRFVKK